MRERVAAMGERAKPRIGRGPYQGMRAHEMGLVYLETDPGGTPQHRHVAIFDGQGDGITTEVDGHSHAIHGLDLEPAADGHTHPIGETRVEPIAYRHYRTLIPRLTADGRKDPCGH